MHRITKGRWVSRLAQSLNEVRLGSWIRRWRTLDGDPRRQTERIRLERRIVRTLQGRKGPYGIDGRVYSVTRGGYLSVREARNASRGPWLDWMI